MSLELWRKPEYQKETPEMGALHTNRVDTGIKPQTREAAMLTIKSPCPHELQ